MKSCLGIAVKLMLIISLLLRSRVSVQPKKQPQVCGVKGRIRTI